MGGDETLQASGHDADESWASIEPEALPERIGRFAVRGVLGRGGMGIVLEAHDERVDREVALKLLHAGTSPRHAERLAREAKALAQLSHPNVVQVYDTGEVGGRVFIAMELVRGQTLAQWQLQRRSWRECVEVYLQAGWGLAAAHAAQLVHRDFKPGNCILDEGGRVRVLDFGLVRDASDAGSSGSRQAPLVGAARDTRSSLTEAGAVLGTLGYMSFEHFDGAQADERSDQFGFCASLYEALHGERPFPGETLGQLLQALMDEQVRPPPPGSSVPRRVRKIVLRGLAHRPSDRWPSMDALLRALEQTLAPRRAWWLVAGLGGVVLVGIGAWWITRPRVRCDDAAERLVGVWDEARKHEVEAAVLATGPPYAADVWAAVEQRLDDHATAWVERYAEACEAGSGGSERTMAEVDLRMACLRRCHGDLREAVEVLAHASPTVVSHALTLVDELPAPSRCDDLDASGSTMLEEAADPRVAAAVDELGGRLSRARSLEHAGEYEAGLRAADAVVQEAEPLGHEPLVAEALLLRGHLREETGRYADAEQDLERAYFLAVELGARELELEAASWLIRVVGFQQQRYDEGRHWGRTALAVARRAPLDREGEARALGHIGTTLWKQGELDDALEHHHRAMAMVEEVLGPEHPLIVDSLNTLGAIASTRERWDEALAHHERALELGQRVLGPGHPHVARSWTNLGLVLAQRGELEAAQDHLQRGLVVYEGAYGPEHPRVGQALGNLASVASRRERFEDAGGYATRAIEIAERSQGPDHPSLVSPLSALAVALARQGRLDEATARQRRALAIAEASLPAGHSLIAGARNDLGVFLFELGELDDALVHFRHALGDYEVKLGPDHPDASRALVNIGKTLLERGDLDGAEASFQRAHGVVERALGAEHPRIVSSLVGLANVALARRDHAAAREHAERAVAIFATHEDDAEDRADADFALARALEEQPGERARARALAQGARDVYAGSPGWYRRNLARVKTWLREHPG